MARLEEHVNAQWHVIEQSKKALDTETAALHKRHTRIRKELKGLVTAREEDGSPATDREVRLLLPVGGWAGGPWVDCVCVCVVNVVIIIA